MEQHGQDRVEAFDARFTDNGIRKLKVILPYFPPASQRFLAIFIKLQELKHAAATQAAGDASPAEDFDFDRLCLDMLPYCTKEEKQRLFSIQNLLRSMGQYRQMMEMMEFLKDLFPKEGPDGDEAIKEGDGEDVSGLLSGLMGMEDAGIGQMADLMQAMASLWGGTPPPNPTE